MSEDLIRRSDAIKALNREKSDWNCDYNVPIDNCIKRLNKVKPAPTIEPKRGEWVEWIDCEGEVFWKCSACGQASEASVAGILYKFCPFCGADMREREDE